MADSSFEHSAHLSRRHLLGASGAAALAGWATSLGATPAASSPLPRATATPRPATELTTRVAVVGAGAFGGWTAWFLRQRGAQVTLFDTWGPGHTRSSSGGETRVIRGMYGADRIYTEWVVRAFQVWREAAERWQSPVYHPTGALWMFRGDDAYARAARPVMAACGLPLENPDLVEAKRRWPQIDFAGVQHVYFEPEAGYLTARTACRHVAADLVAAGGHYQRAAVQPGPIVNGRMNEIVLEDGSRASFDAVVFACGPWLGQLFPEIAAPHLAPTRQEVFYFGTPPGDPRFDEGTLPVWIDFGERIFYGIPGNELRGFKIADDTHGPRLDPTTADRTPTPEMLERARRFIAERFPALAGAPLVESRVCQYTNTADGHLLIDRHPAASNLWLLGGCSGHGFKLGPALGEQVASWVLGEATPPSRFRLGSRGQSLDLGGESQLRTGATKSGEP